MCATADRGAGEGVGVRAAQELQRVADLQRQQPRFHRAQACAQRGELSGLADVDF